MTLSRDGGVVALTLLAVAALTCAPAQAGSGFAGHWVATDGDGSNLTLSINGATGRYAVREVDDAASVCGGAPASVSGAGTVAGSALVVPTTLTCMPGGNIFRERLQIRFTLDTTTDTLTDNDGVLWTRTG